MSEDDLRMQPPAGKQEEKTPGYVKGKIKAYKSGKRRSPSSRARKEIASSLAKVIKKAKSIADLLTEDDQEENLRVIREAKNAVHRIYDKDSKSLVEVPDHKTRLAAVTLDLAYREGTPVARSISATGSLRDMKELLDRTDSSPAYLESLQKELEGKEVTLALPAHDTETSSAEMLDRLAHSKI